VTEGAVQLIVISLPVLVLIAVVLVRAVQVIPQATAAVIERLGRYKTTAGAGTVFLVPFVDKVRERVDLREQVVSFAPQPVITKDGLTVHIDTSVSFQVTDPKAAVYEISDYVAGVEQLTTMTLRDVVGGVSLGTPSRPVSGSPPWFAARWTRPSAAGGSGYGGWRSKGSTTVLRTRTSSGGTGASRCAKIRTAESQRSAGTRRGIPWPKARCC
jgi:hypothetical protein